jgi:hypothetical protein
MSNIKVVTDNTIIKKITVGTPLATVKRIAIEATLSNALDVVADGIQDGGVLVYNEATEKWVAQNLLDLQVIDGGDEF